MRKTRASDSADQAILINNRIRDSGFLLVFIPNYFGSKQFKLGIKPTTHTPWKTIANYKYAKIRKLIRQGNLLEFIETEIAIYMVKHGV